MVKAANLSPYKLRETGRIFPVDVSSVPDFVQRIEIMPESTTGEDTRDLSLYEFVFLPLRAIRRLSKGEPLVKVRARFLVFSTTLVPVQYPTVPVSRLLSCIFFNSSDLHDEIPRVSFGLHGKCQSGKQSFRHGSQVESCQWSSSDLRVLLLERIRRGGLAEITL